MPILESSEPPHKRSRTGTGSIDDSSLLSTSRLPPPSPPKVPDFGIDFLSQYEGPSVESLYPDISSNASRPPHFHFEDSDFPDTMDYLAAEFTQEEMDMETVKEVKKAIEIEKKEEERVLLDKACEEATMEILRWEEEQATFKFLRIEQEEEQVSTEEEEEDIVPSSSKKNIEKTTRAMLLREEKEARRVKRNLL